MQVTTLLGVVCGTAVQVGQSSDRYARAAGAGAGGRGRGLELTIFMTLYIIHDTVKHGMPLHYQILV